MVVRIENPTRKQICGIKLDCRTFLNYKREFSGIQCNSIMALDIASSNGYYDKNGNVIPWNDEMARSNKSGRAGLFTEFDRLMPCSLMYMWQLAVESEDKNIYVLSGRTYEQLDKTLKDLSISSAYQGMARRLIDDNASIDVLNQIINGLTSKGKDDQPRCNINIYAHGLGVPFQHLRNMYNDNFAGKYVSKSGKVSYDTFSRSARTLMRSKIREILGICHVEFIDTMPLVRKSISDWCEDENIPFNQVSNDKVHDIITPETELNEDDYAWMENNLVHIIYGLQKYRERFGGLLKDIPITQTSIVRKELRARVCKTENWAEGEKHGKNEKPVGSVWSRKCADINRSLKPADYARLREIFVGGSVLLNRFKIGSLLHDVYAYDFSSDYVAIATHMLFPVGKFTKVKSNSEREELQLNNDLLSIDRKYMWYAHYRFEGLTTDRQIPFWPATKCVMENSSINRKSYGKIMDADTLDVYMTDVDYSIFSKVYTWEKKETLEMWKSEAGLLPESLIKCFLEYYKTKTNYKGVSGKESIYNSSKQICNSGAYGIAVQKLFEDDVIFTEKGWTVDVLDENKFEEKRKKITPLNTFLSYQCGVWVAIWSHYMLWQFMTKESESRVAYGDTDSLMGEFNDEDKKRFKEWDKWLHDRRIEINKIYPDIKPDMYCPLNSDDEPVSLGSFELEHNYDDFKVIGLKRYSGIDNGELKNTIAGLPKSCTTVHVKTPSDLNETITWAPYESGLIMPTFNDNQPELTWTDRNGKVFTSNEKYGACMKPTGFSLSIKKDIMNMIEFYGSDTWFNIQEMDNPTEPIYIKKSLDNSGDE